MQFLFARNYVYMTNSRCPLIEFSHTGKFTGQYNGDGLVLLLPCFNVPISRPFNHIITTILFFKLLIIIVTIVLHHVDS